MPLLVADKGEAGNRHELLGTAIFGIFDEHLLEDREGSLKSSAGHLWAR